MTGETTVHKSEAVVIEGSNDVVRVRQCVRSLALEVGFSLVEQTKVVTAASELGRNTLEHGLGGNAEISIVDNGLKRGVRMRFEDHGPGIQDISLAMTDGYTSGKGMGLGLSGSKRLMNEFEISSKVGSGTTVTAIRWK